MPISDPFLSQAAAPDRIAYDFYTKLWRLVHEFRATEALSTPRTPDSLYWYEYETDADDFRGNTLPCSSSPSHFSPNLQKYRCISENRGIWPEPMIVEVVLRLPQPSGLIILETWKLNLAYGQSDDLKDKSPLQQRSRMYDECQKFCLAIHICINELPTAKFIRQLQCHDPQTRLKIALRLSSGSADGIEKQFVPYALRTYTFPPAAHVYGNFLLSTTCITDFSRLLADLSLWNYYPNQLGIAIPRNYLQIRRKGFFSPGVSGKQAEKPKLPVISSNNRHQELMENPWENSRTKLAPETFVPPGISKLLHLWDPMTSDSSDGWGKLAERLIQSKDLDALGTGNEVLPSDEAPPHRDSTSRIRSHPILIPPRKIHFLDDHEDARRLMKYIIHENLHPRRRMINSASTAGSCPSPMIAGPSDPITPELQ